MSVCCHVLNLSTALCEKSEKYKQFMHFFDNLEIFDVKYRIFSILNRLYLWKYYIYVPETHTFARKCNFWRSKQEITLCNANYPKKRKYTNFQRISEIRHHFASRITKKVYIVRSWKLAGNKLGDRTSQVRSFKAEHTNEILARKIEKMV